MTHVRRVNGVVWHAALFALAFAAVPTIAVAQPAFTVEQLSPGTQSWPVINFLGPYYYFDLTNTGTVADRYHCEIRNLVTTPPGAAWFPSVCIGTVCYGDTLTIPSPPSSPLGPGMSISNLGINIVPFEEGVGTFDFHVESVTDPGVSFDVYGLTLYVGSYALGIEQSAGQAPGGVVLQQNFPNPVQAGTRIAFALPETAPVTLAVFDVAGRLVDTLAEGALPAGAHAVEWDGTDVSGRSLPAGVYYYRLSTPAGALTKKMTLVR